MWFFIQDIFMVKDPSIGRALVEANRFNKQKVKYNVSRLTRRRNRRIKFKTHNSTQLKTKVK
ncbi:hypothetical protein [Marinicella rhabdoformis]|uniref:hypothetical protein n=1 Tax=Marinicella rhabdoformis TaxID=2580566 RepID=UPI0012AED39C|nr:hypothetical protein [Marinicella rhabdoformis]